MLGLVARGDRCGVLVAGGVEVALGGLAVGTVPPRGGMFGGHGMHRRRTFMSQCSVVVSSSCGLVCSDGARHRLLGMCRSSRRGFRRDRFTVGQLLSPSLQLLQSRFGPPAGVSIRRARFVVVHEFDSPRPRR